MKDHFRPFAAVYAFFIRDGKILLLRRAHTDYEDGKYSLVAGHIDGNETLRQAMVREIMEEAGVNVDPKDLTLKLTLHRLSDREQVDFFFEVKKWKGTIQNKEPKKCDDLDWFPLDELPKNTIPYIRDAIRWNREGISYAELGW